MMRVQRRLASRRIHHALSPFSSFSSGRAGGGGGGGSINSSVHEDPLIPRSRNEWWGRDAGSPQATIAGKNTQPAEPVNLNILRQQAKQHIESLPEFRHLENFRKFLRERQQKNNRMDSAIELDLSYKENLRTSLTAALATLLLHAESRACAFLGHGFYTIGPCGEELLAPLGLILRETDSLALHYRHLSVQIARQLKSGKDMESILLDRARCHVVSASDPVTGGAHCSIRGGPYDFLVTSTLSSQASPAVGRALGNGLAHHLQIESIFPKDFVSFVSVGDGSVNHAHFLAAVNMAEYAAFRNFKVPVLFGITDNHFSISLRGYGWLQNGFVRKFQMPVYDSRGSDLLDVYEKSTSAIDYVRSKQKPAVILYKDVPRRFGHAATDRQIAYMTEQEIENLAASNPLENACKQLVDLGIITYEEISAELDHLHEAVRAAFAVAVNEPKIVSRDEILCRNNSKLSSVSNLTKVESAFERSDDLDSKPSSAGFVMRKHMTSVFDEILSKFKNCVYIGEDVIHGGYYAVTEEMNKKFPHRIQDFPPEETVLVGAGIGYAQTKLLPIVEIPYAKYLDCGADMFYEAILMHWLSNGQQPNGMLIRLQGFDKGVFGG